jgi:hypothetical protein
VLLPFTQREQFRDIVIGRAGSKSERTPLGMVGFCLRLLQQFIQANAQGLVNHLFEWFAELSCAAFCFCSYVRVQSQCCSHANVIMLLMLHGGKVGRFVAACPRPFGLLSVRWLWIIT